MDKSSSFAAVVRELSSCLDGRYAKLSELLQAGGALNTVSSQLFQCGIITRGVNKEPTYDKVVGEFKAKLKFFTKKNKIEKHCQDFLMALMNEGGPMVEAADDLEAAWMDNVYSKLNVKLELKVKVSIEDSQSHNINDITNQQYVQYYQESRYIPYNRPHHPSSYQLHNTLKHNPSLKDGISAMAAMNFALYKEEASETFDDIYSQQVRAEECSYRNDKGTWAVPPLSGPPQTINRINEPWSDPSLRYINSDPCEPYPPRAVHRQSVYDNPYQQSQRSYLVHQPHYNESRTDLGHYDEYPSHLDYDDDPPMIHHPSNEQNIPSIDYTPGTPDHPLSLTNHPPHHIAVSSTLTVPDRSSCSSEIVVTPTAASPGISPSASIVQEDKRDQRLHELVNKLEMVAQRQEEMVAQRQEMARESEHTNKQRDKELQSEFALKHRELENQFALKSKELEHSFVLKEKDLKNELERKLHERDKRITEVETELKEKKIQLNLHLYLLLMLLSIIIAYFIFN